MTLVVVLYIQPVLMLVWYHTTRLSTHRIFLAESDSYSGRPRTCSVMPTSHRCAAVREVEWRIWRGSCPLSSFFLQVYFSASAEHRETMHMFQACKYHMNTTSWPALVLPLKSGGAVPPSCNHNIWIFGQYSMRYGNWHARSLRLDEANVHNKSQ